MLLGTIMLTLVTGVGAFVCYAPAAVGQNKVDAGTATSEKSAQTVTTAFTIEGMTCAACAKGLQATFRNLPGVTASQVDYGKKRAEVTYDPAKQTAESFKKIVREAGYTCK